MEIDTLKVHKKKGRATLLLHEDEVPKKRRKSRLTVQEEPYASGGVVSGKRSLDSLYTCGIFAESWPTWAFHIGEGSVNLKWIHLRSPKYLDVLRNRLKHCDCFVVDMEEMSWKELEPVSFVFTDRIEPITSPI